MSKTTHTERNILLAFLLNLGFSIYEFFGGLFTHSTAIMSDSVHDLGDALSIGIAYLLEKKSRKAPNARYTYGYLRFSLLGGMLTTLILLLGSVFVISEAITRLIHPVAINYDGMLLLAVIGVIVNLIAVYFTRGNDSLNQKSVNLHMLEDVLGWLVVLAGAIVMRFTDCPYIDPLLSISVAIFILHGALLNCKSILDIFLEKVPSDLSITELKEHLLEIPGVKNVHHIHIWSMDGHHNYATLHVITNNSSAKIKTALREELQEHGITHSTIELESPDEHCNQQDCDLKPVTAHAHHHHH